MFSKVALFVAAAFAASAFAGDISESPEYSCNVGSLQCCSQYQQPNTDGFKQLTSSLVGLSATDLNGQAGAECNPITGIGKGNGAGCSTAPTCCSKVYQKQASLAGSVGVNCNPATVIA